MTLIQSTARGLPAYLRRLEGQWARRPGPVLLAGTALTAILLGLLTASPRTLRPSYDYAVGDFAAATIRAPWDLSVLDEEGTARLRDQAARHTAPVAAFDPEPAAAVPARVAQVFQQARDLVAQADARREVPEADLARLGAAARRRLMQARAREADQAVREAAQAMLPGVELQLGVVLTAEERMLLAERQFDRRLQDGLITLFREAHARPIARDLALIRDAADRSRKPGELPRVTLRAGTGAPDRILPDAAMLDDVAGALERMRASASGLLPGEPESDRAVLVGLASRLVTPDTAYDDPATARRQAQAAADVLPVSLQFRRNQLIVDEGREVTREALLVIGFLQEQGMPHAFLRRAAGAAAVTWALLAAMLWLPARVGMGWVPLRDAAFALVALLAATAACWLWLILADSISAQAPGVSRGALVLLFPATAVPMLAGLVLPRRGLVGLCAMIAVSTGLLTDLGILYAAHTLVVGLVAGHLVAPCRQRSCVIRAGGASGLAALVSGLSVAALSNASVGAGEAFASAAGAFAGAAAGGLAALAFSRPVERVFGYSTNLGLEELLSYDHPLLRRFMERAPGTFQHSVSVAMLARTGAEAIGADALLVRVGALYHDVGKMEAPRFFTENQRDGNPHDAMAPRESARVILDHVAHGVDLLTRHRVGRRVADFAREHHGTGTLTVFLQKAVASGAQPDVSDYRYPGPRPRSKETAVLMMADKIEATVRSRGAAAEAEFRSIVDGTIDTLQADGQFDDSPLTMSDLAKLRQAFVSGLVSLLHTRIDYPAAARHP